MAKYKVYKIRPENYIREYLLSKKLTEVLHEKKYGPSIVNPNLHLEMCRKKLYTTEEHLTIKRKEYEERRVELDEKWNEVAVEGRQLKDNFVAFNTFIIANNEKRKRAAANIEYDKKLIQVREEGNRDLIAKIKKVEALKREIDAEIRKHTIYEQYLLQVSDISGEKEFKNADSIVESFEQYLALALEIVKKQSSDFDILQNAKGELAKFEEKQRNVLLGLHTHLAGLHGNYEEAVRKTRHLESLIAKIKYVAHKNFRETMITKDAIRNLYHQVCQKKNVKPHIGDDNFEEQLVYIATILRQYRSLNEELEKLMKRQSKAQNKKK